MKKMMRAKVMLGGMLLGISLIPVAEAGAQIAPGTPELGSSGSSAGEAPWDVRLLLPGGLQEDPADSLYRAARELLNDGRYAEAAAAFGEVRRRYPDSGLVPRTFYWQAFALDRRGGLEDLRVASALLDEQMGSYPDAVGSDARELAERVLAERTRMGDAEAAEDFAQRVRDFATNPCPEEEQEMRIAALSALLNMDSDRAMPILRRVLEDRDQCAAPLREKAVFLIAQQESAAAADILMEVVSNDPDSEVRRQAVFWLSQVEDERAVDLLLQILRTSDDLDLRKNAIFALGQHENRRAKAALRDFAVDPAAPIELRGDAIFWLSQEGSEEDVAFLRDLYGQIDSDQLREKIVFAVSQSDSPGSQRWLLEIALDPDGEIGSRKQALFWAGQSDSPVPELYGLYDRMPERELKEHLIFVYSQIEEPEAFDLLFEIARNEPDIELRKKAIFWLGQSDDPRALEFLEELIEQ